jgi:hypothetical protein
MCYDEDGGDCDGAGTGGTTGGTTGGSADCEDCEQDFTAYGSECCDTAWDEFGISCSDLEATYNWDCTGCNCPGDLIGSNNGQDWIGQIETYNEPKVHLDNLNNKVFNPINNSSSREYTGYNIYRSTSSGGTYSLVGSVDGSTYSLTDLGVTNGVTYYYVATLVTPKSVKLYVEPSTEPTKL